MVNECDYFMLRPQCALSDDDIFRMSYYLSKKLIPREVSSSILKEDLFSTVLLPNEEQCPKCCKSLEFSKMKKCTMYGVALLRSGIRGVSVLSMYLLVFCDWHCGIACVVKYCGYGFN